MAFLSLYRKYRPNSFADLVGQKHVIRTLRNALEYNRIAHAYLFAGPRGTGKTSTAKIYAQALNCIKGPTAEPCGECEACQKIQSGQSIDVIEIDAASNRGIDEIRDLREKVKFYPSEGKYKVYIIDEVHMLTKGAFNALLKTLEEPPANVVFILATTEPHKVIDTIHSRCQRFDFSLLSTNDIIERLEYICKEEGVQYDQQSLNLIASSSNGGLRDAISLLDQTISFTNSNIRVSEIQEMLGKVDISFLQEFMEKVFNKVSSEVLEMINDIINSGKGISIFVDDLIDFLRQAMLYKECGKDTTVFNFTDSIINKIEALAEKTNTERLLRCLDILTGVERELAYADQPRIILELGIIKMMSSDADNSLQGLRSRIAELEYKVRQLLEGKELDNNTTLNKQVEENVSKSKVDEENQKDFSGSNSDGSTDSNSEGNSDFNKNINTGENNFAAETDLKNNTDNTKNTDTENKAEQNQMMENSSTESENGNKLSIEGMENAWSVILNKVKEESISVHAMLMEGKPKKIDEDIFYIQFPNDKNFHRKGAEQQAGLIQKIINKVTGFNYQLQFVNESDGVQSKKKLAKVSDQHKNNKSNNDSKKEKNSVVDEVIKAFNGKIIKVNHHILEDQ